jgi:TonB-like protein
MPRLRKVFGPRHSYISLILPRSAQCQTYNVLMRYRLEWTLFSCRSRRLFRKSPLFPTIVAAVVIACSPAAAQNAQLRQRAAMASLLPVSCSPKWTHLCIHCLRDRPRIAGDVRVKVLIRADGSVESAVVVSGHPMLTQAAMKSAMQSQFECRGCRGEESTPFSMIYTFQVKGQLQRCCCSGGEWIGQQRDHGTQVSKWQDHITVTVDPMCMCPDECDTARAEALSRFRSAKCLYLWKCGTRLISTL